MISAQAIAAFTPQQRVAMAWWVFFGQCECRDCIWLRYAWHAARLIGGQNGASERCTENTSS